MNRPTILLAALALDAVLGEPAWLYARVPHPVVGIGRLLAALERRLNRGTDKPRRRRALGAAAVAALLAVVGATAWLLARGLAAVPGGWLVEALLASTLLAQRSLYQHVAAVAEALEHGGLAAGRRAVASIVGRDPASLDAHGVARAAIESCAENFSDGVVAPALWFLALGLPGLAAYKAINTADSMIGHRTPRWEAFGWAAARLDDAVNLVPARVSGCLIALAAATRMAAARQAFRAMLRDAPRHRSPNAGWPEAAMAGALGVALAGPRRYGGMIVEDGWMNGDGRRAATAADVRLGLRLFTRACLLLAALVAAASVCAR